MPVVPHDDDEQSVDDVYDENVNCHGGRNICLHFLGPAWIRRFEPEYNIKDIDDGENYKYIDPANNLFLHPLQLFKRHLGQERKSWQCSSNPHLITIMLSMITIMIINMSMIT